ncbi:rhomboid-like protein 19 [Rosa rugosa]|uniref:rhomboid-like protein 19 n=1 Tax=Rosa rugosa TaxID=74645 RepID=UPI002B4059C9|nr:rhomboid-like protein 19 [Rosa rugosa]
MPHHSHLGDDGLPVVQAGASVAGGKKGAATAASQKERVPANRRGPHKERTLQPAETVIAPREEPPAKGPRAAVGNPRALERKRRQIDSPDEEEGEDVETIGARHQKKARQALAKAAVVEGEAPASNELDSFAAYAEFMTDELVREVVLVWFLFDPLSEHDKASFFNNDLLILDAFVIHKKYVPCVYYRGNVKVQRTIPFVWNLVTSGYIEQSIFGVVVSTLGLLFIGKLLEPVWGSREFLKFIFVVNFLTSICIFITAIALYYITRKETYLYMPLSGFHGVLSGFLVGIKQMIPDQELPLLKIKAKWLPSLSLLLSIAISFWTAESATYLPILIFGTYMSWIYLRYWQRKPETKLKGDPSEDFAFSTFFPEFLRPVIDPVASIFHRMLCGRSEASN